MYGKLLTFIFFVLYSLTGAQTLEIQIEKWPSVDAGPNTFVAESPREGDSLLSWLGGEENIRKILVSTPYMNPDQVELTEEYIKNRFENSVCLNSKKDKWHYAPFTMGTVYFKDGRKLNFEMYLSGITIKETGLIERTDTKILFGSQDLTGTQDSR